MIYVIDDNAMVRESLAALIESMDFEVTTFHSSKDFLAAFDPDESSTQCVLADLNMPEMGAIELKRKLAELNCDVPVVLMTGHCPAEERRKAESIGIFEILEKPCKLATMKALLERALAVRKG